MMLSWGFAASATIAVLAVGCGGSSSGSSNPLVGKWTTAKSVGTVTVTETVNLNANGTLVVQVTAASATCSGTETTTGFAWAATAASITFSGTADCTGAITCGTVSVACSDSTGVKASACTYALSNNNDTLALTACTGIDDATFTRGS